MRSCAEVLLAGGCGWATQYTAFALITVIDRFTGLPLTTKEDKNFHGFGVRSIWYIVEKYKGDLLMRTSQERFLVDILFYCNQA